MTHYSPYRPTKGDSVEFLGWCEAQVRWGNNDTPSELIEGRFYVIEDVEVHSQHTKVKVQDYDGWFNSVHFAKLV